MEEDFALVIKGPGAYPLHLSGRPPLRIVCSEEALPGGFAAEAPLVLRKARGEDRIAHGGRSRSRGEALGGARPCLAVEDAQGIAAFISL
jgi:hypothetical protein